MSRGGYAQTSDGLYIAYREWGEKDPVHLYLSEVGASVDTRDMHPSFIRLWRQLGAICRTVSLDRRNTGASDTVTPYQFANLDDFVLDILAVVDKIGAEQIVLTGEGTSGMAAAVFAARYPDRVARLALINSAAKATLSEDYPWAAVSDDDIALIGSLLADTWGDGSFIAGYAPGLAADPTFVEVCGLVERMVCTPSAMAAFIRGSEFLDIRDTLSQVAVPTLVYFTGDLLHVTLEQSRDLAERIPGARFVEARGGLFYQPDDSPQLDTFAEFIGGRIEPDDASDAAVLFLDVVDSTATAARVGDATWIQIVDDLDAFVRREVEHHSGRVVNFTGDGHVAIFDRASDAVETAIRLSGGVGALGLAIRAGVHAGLITLRKSGDVGGLAIHMGARVMAQAHAGGILVSAVVEAGLREGAFAFEDAGFYEFKGFPGKHQLFDVARQDGTGTLG